MIERMQTYGTARELGAFQNIRVLKDGEPLSLESI